MTRLAIGLPAFSLFEHQCRLSELVTNRPFSQEGYNCGTARTRRLTIGTLLMVLCPQSGLLGKSSRLSAYV